MQNFESYHKSTIPLCAAENIISPFSKIPLSSSLQERYIMNGIYEFCIENNFIGSETLYPFYKLINKQCTTLFGSTYADARTLSGMNSITTVLMSLTKQGDSVMVSMPDCGGHPSIPEICYRLGLKIVSMPYNYDKYDFDYERINKILKSQRIDMIVIAPSDILFAPILNRLEISENTILVYDATQILGLIAGKMLPNPFVQNKNTVLLGGTHKTLPGPTCGLIMTQNTELAKLLDKTINPKYIRNTQMHQIASLILTLIEMEYFGESYQKQVVLNANTLGKSLELKGFNVAKINDVYSQTHQIFIHLNEQLTNFFYKKAIFFGITLNKKEKLLFRNYGLRLGVQEITRYGWNKSEITIISEIFSNIQNNCSDQSTLQLINCLNNNKQVKYCFDSIFIEQVIDRLQQK